MKKCIYNSPIASGVLIVNVLLKFKRLTSNLFKLFQAMAKKLVTLYQLADEQLSKQHHYDWSLRSLKAVIKLAAKMRLHQLNVCESVILIQALHQINLSKLSFEDVPLFSGLIKVI